MGPDSRTITLLRAPGSIKLEIGNIGITTDWRTPIIKCIKGERLESQKEQAALESRARYFCMKDDVLFKRSFTRPHLRCLGHTEEAYVLKEAHEGCCGNHSGGRALANRLLRAGYFWPNMKKNAMEYVRRCEKCQMHGPLIHVLGEAMTIMTSPCPFAHEANERSSGSPAL